MRAGSKAQEHYKGTVRTGIISMDWLHCNENPTYVLPEKEFVSNFRYFVFAVWWD
jgi:hypothetical protein